MPEVKRFMVRQGDVLIMEDTIPGSAVPMPRHDDRIVLADGEVTGHAHIITDTEVEMVGIADEIDRWLRVRSQVSVRHEEHGAVTVSAGDRVIRRQREYSPAATRLVAD